MSENTKQIGAIKILLVGDSKVGKSSLVARYTENSFNETGSATIGIDFKIKNIDYEGKIVKLHIWDTAGQEKFKSIVTAYYRGAHGAIVMFDLTDRETFLNVKKWIQDVDRYGPSNLHKILVGSKADLERDRKVTEKDINDCLAEYKELEYIETSAKTDTNIGNVFLNLVKNTKNKTEIVNFDIKQKITHFEIDNTTKSDNFKNKCCQ